MKIKLIVSILLIVIIGLMGCSSPAAETETATVTSTATTTETVKPYIFKFCSSHTTADKRWPATQGFVDEIAEKSGGRMIIDMYAGQSLVKSAEVLEAIQTGVADMGYTSDPYFPEKLSLMQMWTNPPLWKSSLEGSVWLDDLYDEYFAEEFNAQDLHAIGCWVLAPYGIYTRSTPINKLEDFQGLTMRSGTTAHTAIYAELGAIPVNIAFTDTFEALQKGTVDGTGFMASTTAAYKIHETGKPGYWIDPGPGIPTTGNTFTMNLSLYKSLPGDLQQIIDEVGRDNLSVKMAELTDEQEVAALDTFKEFGTQIIVWSDAEKARMKAKFAPMWDEWAAKADAAGHPGTELVKAIRAKAGG